MAGKSSGIIRSLTKRLRAYAKDRRLSFRRDTRSRASLPFIVTLVGKGRAAKALRDAPSLVGHTRDMSESGLTLLVPSVRVGDAYLTDGETCLEVKLELPGGPVAMIAAPVRFEQLPRKEAGCGYLLAVRIVKMRDDAGDRYKAHLKTIRRKEKRSGGSRKDRTNAAPAVQTPPAPQAGTWEALTPASVSKAFEKFVKE